MNKNEKLIVTGRIPYLALLLLTRRKNTEPAMMIFMASSSKSAVEVQGAIKLREVLSRSRQDQNCTR